MFVGEQDAVELLGRDSALLEPQDDLARAQSAIDQNPAMIGRDERAIPGATAAEHGQTEHGACLVDSDSRSQIEICARITVSQAKRSESRCDRDLDILDPTSCVRTAPSSAVRIVHRLLLRAPRRSIRARRYAAFLRRNRASGNVRISSSRRMPLRVSRN